MGRVDRMPIKIGAVELPQVQVCGLSLDRPPPDGKYALQMAVNQHRFSIGIIEPVVIGQTRQHRRRKKGARRRPYRSSSSLRGRPLARNKGAVHKYIAVVSVRIANPHEWPDRLNLAMIEERRPDAENGITIANDPAVSQVDRAAQINGVARALDIHLAHNILLAVDQQPLGLARVVVAYRKVAELNARGLIG